MTLDKKKSSWPKYYDLSVSDFFKLKPFSGLNMEKNFLKYQILLNVIWWGRSREKYLKEAFCLLLYYIIAQDHSHPVDFSDRCLQVGNNGLFQKIPTHTPWTTLEIL